MIQKLTDWFPADVEPVHVGVYQRSEPGQKSGFRYWYWNGAYWEVGGWLEAEFAVLNHRSQSICTDHLWRGLAVKP